jgi:hypothetical protein
MGTRRRYGIAGIAILLTLAAAVGRGQSNSDIAGTYFCEGTNSDGSAYHGVVTIARRADAYYLRWELQPAVSAFGVGLREGDTLGVSYYGPNTGIIVYRIEGERLIGRWTVPGANDLASETLTPLDEQLVRPGRPRPERPAAPAATGSGLPIRL